MLSDIGGETALNTLLDGEHFHIHVYMINESFVFPVSACRCCCCCCEVHDTLQYHTTALMPLHSLSVLCRALMLNGLALVHS